MSKPKKKSHFWSYVVNVWMFACGIVGSYVLFWHVLPFTIHTVGDYVMLPSRVAALEEEGRGVGIGTGLIIPGHNNDDGDRPHSKPLKQFTCKDDLVMASVDVMLVDHFDEEGVLGTFNPMKGEIIIATTSSNTISHEVSHLVDAIMGTKGMVGTETRAYIQGYFTECIFNKTR